MVRWLRSTRVKRVVIEKAHMLLWAPGVRPSDPLCLTRMTRWPQCGTTSMPSTTVTRSRWQRPALTPCRFSTECRRTCGRGQQPWRDPVKWSRARESCSPQRGRAMGCEVFRYRASYSPKWRDVVCSSARSRPLLRSAARRIREAAATLARRISERAIFCVTASGLCGYLRSAHGCSRLVRRQPGVAAGRVGVYLPTPA